MFSGSTLTDIDKTAHMAIPVRQPWGGVIIESRLETLLFPKKRSKTFSSGDVYGRLFLLFLVSDADGKHIVDMNSLERYTNAPDFLSALIQLSKTSLASAIAYLDNGNIFIGSHFGDSQLVKLLEEQNAFGAYLKIVDAYNNLARSGTLEWAMHLGHSVNRIRSGLTKRRGIVRDRTAILNGDLLEQLLDMPKEDVQAILNARKGGLAVDSKVEDVLSMVEELSYLKPLLFIVNHQFWFTVPLSISKAKQ
ncbi:hypothetical protein BJ742DRAFT_742395 [Cladochytrium replicatum]|nr:hypothetical protein BJ742DRAFT_742395 [Cladochytrium replicatum]